MGFQGFVLWDFMLMFMGFHADVHGGSMNGGKPWLVYFMEKPIVR